MKLSHVEERNPKAGRRVFGIGNDQDTTTATAVLRAITSACCSFTVVVVIYIVC